jgi:hypothetical protein
MFGLSGLEHEDIINEKIMNKKSELSIPYIFIFFFMMIIPITREKLNYSLTTCTSKDKI